MTAQPDRPIPPNDEVGGPPSPPTILAPPGWAAVFGPNEGEEGEHIALPIVAFDAAGAALVVDAQLGGLVPANSYSNFRYLHVADDDPGYVAYLPGGGWRIAYGHDEANAQVEDVVAWAVNRFGDATPIHRLSLGAQDRVWAAEWEEPDYAHLRLIPPAQSAHTVSPNGRPKATGGRPNVPPMGGVTVPPNGRVGSPPPTNGGPPNGLTDLQHVRLGELAQEFPGELPSRDKVMAHMQDKGYQGWTSNQAAGELIRALRAQRQQLAAADSN